MTTIKLKETAQIEEPNFYKVVQWFKSEFGICVLTQVNSNEYLLIGIDENDANRYGSENLFCNSSIYGVYKTHNVFTNLTPISVTISED